MQLSHVAIRGYRNFRHTSIALQQKSLVIGYNDVGKTNLLRAIRLLLDRTVPDSDLDPRDSDFYIHSETNEIEITLQFTDVVEDCLITRFKGLLSDTGDVFIRYRGSRDAASGKKTYQLLCGPELERMRPIESRFYLKSLNLRFVESRRDLQRFIRRERRLLLEEAKENRDDNTASADQATLVDLVTLLRAADDAVGRLHYVRSATTTLNDQLALLSYRNEGQTVSFVAGAADPEDFASRLELATMIDGKAMALGGDGRSNQVQLALWTARNALARAGQEDPEEITLYCIEEPEAHLHPHQQRKLAAYLATTLESQVIITSHSPQIAAEFAPKSLIRLYEEDGAVAAGGGALPSVEDELLAFGFRLNALSAEAFFASAVLLVEGPSEVIFYRGLARALNLDLDRSNVSILAVNGVGFRTYASLLQTLGIKFVVRTDRDIFRVRGTSQFRHAGVLRATGLCKEFRPESGEAFPPAYHETLEAFDHPIPPDVENAANECVKVCNENGIFLADDDLEIDLANQLTPALQRYTGLDEVTDIVASMKEAKATFMFDFVRTCVDDLRSLGDSPLSEPLRLCVEMVDR